MTQENILLALDEQIYLFTNKEAEKIEAKGAVFNFFF